MKHDTKQIVRIPVGCVCIPLHEVIYTHTELADLRSSNADMAQLIKQRDYRVSELEAQVTELSKKLSDTEEELSRENDSKLYWYKKFMELSDKIEREKEATDAATEAT